MSTSPPSFSLALTRKGQVKLARKYVICALRIVYEDRHIISWKQLKTLIGAYDMSVTPLLCLYLELSVLRLGLLYGYDTTPTIVDSGRWLHF